jgi:hypothetical protein
MLYICGTILDVKSEAELIKLSETKLKAAESLLNNHFPDDAYYIGGYAFELLLKAKICKTLCLPDFFDFDNSGKRKLPKPSGKRNEKENLYKPYKVHDYEQLIILSGLFAEFSEHIATNPIFNADWSVISNWDENKRYTTVSNEKDVTSFIDSLKNMTSWLTQRL